MISTAALESLQTGSPKLPRHLKLAVRAAFPNREIAYEVGSELSDERISFDAGYLVSPQETVMIFYNDLHPLGRLGTRQLRKVEEALARSRGRLEPDWFIPKAMGPDGKTAMVFAPNPGSYYSDKGLAKLVDTWEIFSFATEAQAREAAKYLAPPFKPDISKYEKRWYIRALHKMPEGSIPDDQEPYRMLATRFGGKFEASETVTYEYQPPAEAR